MIVADHPYSRIHLLFRTRPQPLLCSLIFGVCLSFIPSVVFAQVVQLYPQIYHLPILEAPAYRDLEIQVQTEEGAAQISFVQLIWRIAGGEFRASEMDPVSGGYRFTIPAIQMQPPHLEYAVLIHFQDGRQASFPLRDPLQFPNRVAITQPLAQEAVGPQFVILRPQDGEILFESDVSIAVSVFDPDTLFDPMSLLLFLDGKQLQAKEISGTFILAQAHNLSSGRHEITIRSKSPGGRNNPDFRCFFQVAGAEGAHLPTTFFWESAGEAILEDFSGGQEGILRGDLRTKGGTGKWQYAARSYLTSEEAWDRQPQDRFLLSLKRPSLSFSFGDVTPQFSDLVLAGKRVRGTEIGLYSSHLHLLGVFGEVNKEIPNLAYRRMLFGIRPYYTTSFGASWGLSFLKAKDISSPDRQTYLAPQDNVVVGMDAHVPILRRKLDWSFAAAMSLTALDIRGGTISREALEEAGIEIPFDPNPLEPIIVINESLTPPDLSKWSSLAWMTSLNFNQSGQWFSAAYRSVGPVYYTFGNPYLQNDLAGWHLSDQFSLWKRRFFINLGLSRMRDNLDGNKTATTVTSGGWATIAFYPNAPAPQVTFTVNFTRGNNDLNRVDTLTVQLDSSSITQYSDLRRDDYSKIIGASLVQSIFLRGIRQTITLNVNRTNFQDEIADRPPDFVRLNSSTKQYGINWRSDFLREFNASLDYSYYSSEIVSQAYRYHLFGTTMNSFFRKQRVRLSFGIHRRVGDWGLSRWQNQIAAEWEFYPKHTLKAAATRYFNDSFADEGIFRLYYFKRY